MLASGSSGSRVGSVPPPQKKNRTKKKKKLPACLRHNQDAGQIYTQPAKDDFRGMFHLAAELSRT